MPPVKKILFSRLNDSVKQTTSSLTLSFLYYFLFEIPHFQLDKSPHIFRKVRVQTYLPQSLSIISQSVTHPGI